MSLLNPSHPGRIYHFRNLLAHYHKHRLHPGVIQQRLLVAHEELVELHSQIGKVSADTKNIRGDFGYGRHISNLQTTTITQESVSPMLCSLLASASTDCSPSPLCFPSTDLPSPACGRGNGVQ